MFDFFKKKKPSQNTQALKLTLSGLHCSSCAVNIDLSLEDLPGVVNSKTNYVKSFSTVDFDPEKTDPQKIIVEIIKLGYQAEKLN